MKNLKFAFIILFASLAFVACDKSPVDEPVKEEPKIEQEKVYEVNVKLNKEGKDEPSMSNATLEPIAILKEKAGKRVLTIKVKPLVFAGMTGNLIDLVYLKKRAKKIIGTPEGHNAYEFEIDETPTIGENKQEILTVKLFIDAMGVLYDETKGPEDQKGQEADLVIEHNSKKEVKK